MTCTKCGGLVIDEAFDPRCVNCGRPPGWEAQRIEDESETASNDATASKGTRKRMGKWTPEAREAHKQRMREIWASKRKGGGATAVVKAAPKVAVTRPVHVATVGDALTELDAAIAARMDDVAVLERAKAILSGE